MAIDSLGQSAVAQTSNIQSSGIGQDDFIKILMTQLTYQDPLKPLDNQQFIAQMAQFTSLEESKQLNDKVDSLLSMQSASQSIGLIGKTVEVASGGASSTGQVTTITFSSGQPRLTVQIPNVGALTDVSLSQISLIK